MMISAIQPQTTDWRVVPTPMLTRDTPVPQRLLEVHFAAARVPRPARLDVTVGRHRAAIDLGIVHPGDTKIQFLVPEVTGDVPGEVRLTLGDDTWQGSFDLAPARPWTLYVVPHSHTDLGFTHTVSEVEAIHDDNTDEAVTLCELTRDWPEDTRFKWTCEVSWQLQNYIRNRSPQQLASLQACLHSGQMEVEAFYAGVHTDLCSTEELVRSLYLGADLRRRWGIPVDTVMITDIPGATWAFPQILAKAGVHYLIVADNNFVAPFLSHTDVPRPFYWEAPEGSRVLSWYTDEPRWVYIEGFSLGFDKGYGDVLRNLPDKLVALESAGYPYDAYQVQFASDNCRVLFRPTLIAREWQERWANPRVVIATAREFLAHIEQAYGDQIPTCRGDWTNWWSATAIGFARQSGIMRHVKAHLATAESLGAWLAKDFDPSSAEIAAAYDKLLVFDEHSGPKSLAIPKSETHQLRALYEGIRFPEDARALTAGILNRGLSALAERISNSAEEEVIAVVNPLSWSRTDLVEVDVPDNADGPLAMVDTASGESTLLQPCGPGRARFLAAEVPPCGYKIFHLARRTVASQSELQVTSQGLENRFYRLTLDPHRGLCQLVDKALGWEMLDQANSHALGELLWHRSMPPRKFSWEAGTFNFPELYDGTPVPGEIVHLSPEEARLTVVSRGPISATVCLERDAEPFFWQQHISLYADLKRIDITNTLTPKPNLSEIEDLTGYFVFPFALDAPRFRVELPGALLRPEEEQLKGGCRDFLAVQHWAAVYNDGYCAVLCAPDSPLIELGRRSPTFQQYQRTAEAESGFMWVRALSTAGLKGLPESPWAIREPLVFRFSLTTQNGALDPVAAAHHGWGTLNPLLARTVAPLQEGHLPAHCHSWCQVGPANVLLVTAKVAEDADGLVFRLWESSGKDTIVSLELDEVLGPFSSWRTNMVEDDLEELQVNGRTVRLPMAGFGIETVRVRLERRV